MIRLEELRKKRAVTQYGLSVKSGVPQQTISAIEKGIIKNPGIVTMARIAGALSCSIDELMDDDKQVPKAAEK